MPGKEPVSPNDATLITSRLQDFFGHRTPWHRRLWSIGTVLTLQEVVEYADACISGEVPNTEGLRFVIETALRDVRRDPGVTTLAAELVRSLEALAVGTPSKVPRSSRDELEQAARLAEREYCTGWCKARTDTAVEFSSRAIASHLLDLGFSSDHLHRWISAKRGDIKSIAELAEETRAMVAAMPIQTYDVFIPCAAPYAKPGQPSGTVRWIAGPEAAKWLDDRVPEDEHRRHNGGFLIRLEQRDPWAAVNAARAIIARADARAKVARPSNDAIRLDGWARVGGNARSFEIRATPRQVEIGSLHRQNAVYRFDDGLPNATDDALELASYMESPSAGAAIAGGWAAIEALLIRPGEGSHHLAADRLAALVACSLPRAELTPLAYRHVESDIGDELAQAIGSAHTNQEKVELVERHLRAGHRLTLSDTSDLAAENRILAIIADPSAELHRIHRYVTESLRRLYNQRNTISHSGSFRSVSLAATTRTSFSLVGAGLDRIVHAQLQTNGELVALGLVARAQVELRLAGSPGGRELSSLLD